MQIFRGFAIVTAAAVLGLVSPVLAQAADSGFYLGGSIGQSTLKVPSDVTDIPDFDENDTGYKIFGGYNFNLALINLGIEGGEVTKNTSLHFTFSLAHSPLPY